MAIVSEPLFGKLLERLVKMYFFTFFSIALTCCLREQDASLPPPFAPPGPTISRSITSCSFLRCTVRYEG